MAHPKSAAVSAAPKKETRSYFYALGRRKTSVAQVRLFPKGKGELLVNGKKAEEYFFGTLLEKVLYPLKAVGMMKSFDIVAIVKGGGLVGQSDAISHGLARVLAIADEGLRLTLKRAGFLTRDARVKERKKFGLKKARRSPQWSKR